MIGKTIRSKKTGRVFRVLKEAEHDGHRALFVKLISSSREEHANVFEPFWLEHSEWEEAPVHCLDCASESGVAIPKQPCPHAGEE